MRFDGSIKGATAIHGIYQMPRHGILKAAEQVRIDTC
jgi:hypothetical protein